MYGAAGLMVLANSLTTQHIHMTESEKSLIHTFIFIIVERPETPQRDREFIFLFILFNIFFLHPNAAHTIEQQINN